MQDNSSKSLGVRNTKEIIEDLQKLSEEPGFIYTFSFLCFISLWSILDSLIDTNWRERPNNRELSFLLRLMIQHPLNLAYPNSEEVLYSQNHRALDLLDELHRAHTFANAENTDSARSTPIETQATVEDRYSSWLTAGPGMVEPIFYGGEGGNSLQFLRSVEKRYKSDSEWLKNYLGTDINSIIDVIKQLESLQNRRAALLDLDCQFTDMCRNCLDLFSFSKTDLTDADETDVDALIQAFCVTPGEQCPIPDNIGDYNKIHSHPIVALENGQFFLPLPFYLTRSVYESPFYWMNDDHNYKYTADRNRGEAIELMAYDLLKSVFGDKNVYRNLKIKENGEIKTDIDVLAICDNKALIVQAKSKRLTVPSRMGSAKSLQTDFQDAVQLAYNQGKTSRTALLQPGYEFINELGDSVPLNDMLVDAYIICLTGDHYPAVAVQIRNYLKKAAVDPHPLAISIFDLEILSHYLQDPFDFLYYMRQRSYYADQFLSHSEMALLGFHLENKLSILPEANSIFINESSAQVVYMDYLISIEQLPISNSRKVLTFGWKDEPLNQLLEDIKDIGQLGISDAIFFLLDMASEWTKELFTTFRKLQRATITRKQPIEISMNIGKHHKGVSIVSYPFPSSATEAQSFRRHFAAIAVAQKYRSYASEWVALASILGSPKFVDMVAYSREPWKPDLELDELARDLLKENRALNDVGRALRRKPSRNDQCPCGSQIKYKKCHGRTGNFPQT